MEFFDLKDISERDLDLINPSSSEKVITIGQFAGLAPGKRVIDFGCGFGEALALWAEYFGITGIGIDIRPYACQRARQKISERNVAGKVEIVQGSASDYRFEPESFDAVVCMGATFIWGGFRQALRSMRLASRPEGRLVVGQPYWLHQPVPTEYAQTQTDMFSEFELLHMSQQEGFDLHYLIRSSHDDWDRYEAGNWDGLLRWLEGNPQHPDRQQVLDHLHASQEEYLRYGREYMGWAMYVLDPAIT